MGKKIIVISGPSGSGKSSIVKEIINSNMNVMFSVSACTRRRRYSEKEGRDYYFLTEEKFKEGIKNNLFIEWEEVYKNQFYGTLKSEITRAENLDKNLIFDIDVVGALNIKSQFSSKTLSIFIMPPSLETLEERLKLRRTENSDSLSKRLGKAKEEMKKSEDFDKVIINKNLQVAIDQVCSMIKIFLQK